MTIDLSKAHVGQRYVARDGEVWRYVGPTANSRLRHNLTDQNGEEYDFCDDGYFWHPASPSNHDLLRALDSPAPAPAEPERVEPPIKDEWQDRAHYAEGVAEAAMRDRDEALLRATKAEAALGEARKVIAQAKDALSHCYDVNDYPANGTTSQDEAIHAADAWIAKHGGGAL